MYWSCCYEPLQRRLLAQHGVEVFDPGPKTYNAKIPRNYFICIALKIVVGNPAV